MPHLEIDKIPQQTQISPIGGGIENCRPGRITARAERLEVKNELAKLERENEMHLLAKDRGYIDWIYKKMETVEDERARLGWGKVIADIMRLGKREPVTADANQAGGAQITINIVMPDKEIADNILDLIPIRAKAKLADASIVADGESPAEGKG